MAESEQWLTYAEAGKRIGRNDRTVRRWAREGMPMRWAKRDGQRVRVVELAVLQKWFRDTLQASPVHFYRLRKRMAEEGEDLAVPERFRYTKERLATRHQEDPERASDGRTEPESDTPERKVDPLADMKPLKGGAEYYELTERLRVMTPSCAGMPEFTADRVSPEDAERLAGICSGCPLLEQCCAFALTSKPAAGFWAGAARR
ncbi:WhiB family transcriptional regulator [Microbacterium sp.]|uniref:WhiB family transcriptional regulator n=1 Tax=Microbacterium sp. TaxID=51671 RepID=UPI00356ABCBC